MTEILFGARGGAGAEARVPEPAAAEPAWWQILEAAYVQLTDDPERRALYGDPHRGATLAQAWRTAQLHGVPAPIYLLAAGQDRVEAAGIETLTIVARNQFTSLIRAALNVRARAAVQLFVFDGRAGHSVTAFGADRDGILFHDPWPGDSLLSAANNAAGVDARRHGELWRITDADLERVLVAAFVSPGFWTAMTGQPSLRTLGELRGSEFWSFFGIHEVARDDEDPTYVTITLQPGGFTEYVELDLTCYEDEAICLARLNLLQSWVIGPPTGINPLATDIVASWLEAMTPSPDTPLVAPLARELRSLRIDDELKAKTHDPAWTASEPGRLVAAYLGLSEETFATAGSLTFLVAETAGRQGSPWTQLELRLG